MAVLQHRTRPSTDGRVAVQTWQCMPFAHPALTSSTSIHLHSLANSSIYASPPLPLPASIRPIPRFVKTRLQKIFRRAARRQDTFTCSNITRCLRLRAAALKTVCALCSPFQCAAHSPSPSTPSAFRGFTSQRVLLHAQCPHAAAVTDWRTNVLAVSTEFSKLSAHPPRFILGPLTAPCIASKPCPRSLVKSMRPSASLLLLRTTSRAHATVV